jgi:signal transduction histidine kinase
MLLLPDVQRADARGLPFPPVVASHENGGLLGSMLGALADVPADLAAQIEAALVRAAINESDEGVAIFDLSGPDPVIRFANDRYVAMYGQSNDAAVDSQPTGAFPSLVGPVERLFVLAEIAKLEQGAVLRLHKVITRADGSTLPIDTEIQPLRADHDLVLVRWSDASGRLAAEAVHASASESETLTNERERVARDLHDTVIQQLFATGLSLLSTASRTTDQLITNRLNTAVNEIDDAIRQLRTSIFASAAPSSTGRQRSTRQAIIAIVHDAGRMFVERPILDVDHRVDDERWLTARLDLEASLRECLANVARHAAASNVSVKVSCTDGSLEMRVDDDGIGMQVVQPAYGNGLANLTARAAKHGGSFRLVPRNPAGTSAIWSIPAPT